VSRRLFRAPQSPSGASRRLYLSVSITLRNVSETLPSISITLPSVPDIRHMPRLPKAPVSQDQQAGMWKCRWPKTMLWADRKTAPLTRLRATGSPVSCCRPSTNRLRARWEDPAAGSKRCHGPGPHRRLRRPARNCPEAMHPTGPPSRSCSYSPCPANSLQRPDCRCRNR